MPHAPLPNADQLSGQKPGSPILSPEKKKKLGRRSRILGGNSSASVKTDQQRSDLWRERKHERRQNGETRGLQAQKSSSEPGEEPVVVPEKDSCMSGCAAKTTCKADVSLGV